MLTVTDKPIMVQANAGLPHVDDDGNTVFDIQAPEYAEAVAGMIEDGVSGILSGDSDDELLAALIRAFGEEGRRIAKTAAQYAAPFSTQGFAEKVEACYMKAIEAHKRG